VSYDVIGDVHGHARTLVALLEKLGYRRRAGVYDHPQRRAVFVGDLIDRGPRNREVIAIVRGMVETGRALAVLGNHELNAIQYATPGPDGEPLRPHTVPHVFQHRSFLDEYEHDPGGWQDAVAWFRTLPVCLDLGGLRVVHACWSDAHLAALAPWLDADGRVTEAGIAGSVAEAPDGPAAALRVLVQGPEYELPEALAWMDRAGRVRRKVRIRWWSPPGTTLRDALLLPAGFDHAVSDAAAAKLDTLFYPPGAPPVCFGHYWQEGRLRTLAHNVACVDYSVARWGRLAAYRWDGESRLDPEKLVGVGP
jgi:hypothetical protein